MKTKHMLLKSLVFLMFIMLSPFGGHLIAQETGESALDKKVKAFLKANEGKWRDMNVPASDGKLLYDIIIKNGYTKGLEIGTSTGHSTVWIAWAFSKTGGKLITIDIDKSRHKQALAHLKEAGLLDYVDARLADAHELVRELNGPFDFVFSDADKGWYTNYFKDVTPKLEKGGCFTAHNVRPAGEGGRGMSGTVEYLEYVQGQETYTTTVDNSGGGLAISYKN